MIARRSGTRRPAVRGVFAQAEVRAAPVVVGETRAKYAAEMPVVGSRQQCHFTHVLILSGVPAESNTGSAMTTFWRTTRGKNWQCPQTLLHQMDALSALVTSPAISSWIFKMSSHGRS